MHQGPEPGEACDGQDEADDEVAGPEVGLGLDEGELRGCEEAGEVEGGSGSGFEEVGRGVKEWEVWTDS